MGGDAAPAAIVAGAVDYARSHPTVTIVAVGQSEAIYACLRTLGPTPDNITVHDAAEVIDMGEKITALREKPNDSMNTCARLLKEDAVDAIVLCGNTGCSVAASQLHLGRIAGVKRAGILTPLPNIKSTTWVIDCGANATAKAEYLVQWAEMGAAFLECYAGQAAPRVGVLSIGTEEGKGDDLTSRTHELLRETHLNVIGLVEGNQVFDGTVDVVVCDGFTGNVLLKSAEGVAAAVGTIIKEGVRNSLRAKLGAWLMKPAFQHLRRRTHWSSVGGAILAGVNGIVIIGHGRSDPVAVGNALEQARRCVDGKLIAAMREHLSREAPTARRASFFDSVKHFFKGGSSPETPPPKIDPLTKDNFDHRGIGNQSTERIVKPTEADTEAKVTSSAGAVKPGNDGSAS